VRLRLLLFLTSLLAPAALTGQPVQTVTLQKLFIADSAEHVAAIPVERGGDSKVVVQDVPVLSGPEFLAVIAPYVGQPISLERANALAGDLKQYAVKKDRLVNIVLPYKLAGAQIIISTEDAAAGILRLVAVVTKYNDLDFKGNRWFSDKLLRDKLGIQSGDEISISRLDEAVNWANTNPFRRLQVLLMPLEGRPDSANLVVGVVERLPVRFLVAYDDTGNRTLGKRRYTGSLQYGNFLGRDHQLSYQFGTSDHQGVFKAHSLTYQVPLPSRHRFDFSASYLAVNPSLFGGVFNQTGRNVGLEAKYTIPLRTKDRPVEVFGAINYKQNNNNLAYGGFNFGGLTDIFSVSTGLSTVRRDKLGIWAFGLTLHLSPGQFNSRNTNDAFVGKTRASFFNTGRTGARARYAYGIVSVQRVQNLDAGWQFISRATAQVATANLLGSEQFSIGGSTTVRGFDERIMTGDAGFVISNDVQTPAFVIPTKFLPKRLPPLQARILAFYDAGNVRNTHPTINDIAHHPLASTGFGVRLNLGVNFNLSADYGWQITRIPPFYSSSRNRGHVKVLLAY
jgi:hemolysin activation/secretion protein